MMLIQHSLNSDRLSNIQSRGLQADWFILEINEKATLNINMPYSFIIDLGYVMILAYLADPATQVYSYRSVCIKPESDQLYNHLPQYLRLPSCFMKLNLFRYS